MKMPNNNKKKRVLYVDPICYGAHRHYNFNNIRILSSICSLSLYIRNNYLDLNDINLERVLFWNEKYSWDNIPHRSKLSFFLKTQKALLHNYKKAFKMNKIEKYDLVIFSCIDMPLFSILTKFKKSKNVAFIDHGIYLSLERKSYKFFWKYLNRNLKVCVLEEYFYPYIKEQLKKRNDVFLIKHPLGDLFDFHCKKNSCGDKLLLFAPSASNSKEIAIELMTNSRLIPKNVLIIYKSDFDYCNANLRIYSSSLDREKYEELFSSSDGIIIPYEKNYNYRTSGVIFEAAANHKPVFIKSGNTLEFYIKKYPIIFNCFNDTIDLFKKVLISNIFNVDCSYFESFKKDYCDKEMIDEFNRLLNCQSINK